MNTYFTDFKPTFVPWYEVSFREKTRRMTPVQRMFYRNLLMESYWGEQRPALTSDDHELWELAEAESLEQWLQNKDAVLKHFFPAALEDGTLVLKNKRVQEEWSRMIGLLEKKSNAGKASAAARQARVAGQKNPPAPPRKQYKTGHDTTSTSHKSVERCSAGDDRCSTGVEEVGVEVAEREPLPQGPESASAKKKTHPSLMSEIQEAAIAIFGSETKTGAKDPQRADDLESRLGHTLLLKTWEVWLTDEANHYISEGNATPRDYLFSHFATNGMAECIALRIAPYLDAGFNDARAIAKLFPLNADLGNLTPEDISILEPCEDIVDQYSDFCNANHGGTLKDLAETLKCQPEIKNEAKEGN